MGYVKTTAPRLPKFPSHYSCWCQSQRKGWKIQTGKERERERERERICGPARESQREK